MELKPKPKLAIVGLGLLGASLGMALRGGAWTRVGWARRAEVRSWALANDVVDETAEDVDTLLRAADVTILFLPIPAICAFLGEHAGAWKRGAVVSDAGSVKGVVMAAAAEHLGPAGVRFVGGHPMAGTEKSGPESAFPSLYDRAEVFLVPGVHADADAVSLVASVWHGIGAKTVEIGAEAHDSLLAHTSHLLHVVASALTLGILDAPGGETRALRFSGCATGFKDSARIAASNPAMWREIVEANRPAVLEALDEFQRRLDRYREMIESGDFDRFEEMFARGKALRDEWNAYKFASPSKTSR